MAVSAQAATTGNGSAKVWIWRRLSAVRKTSDARSPSAIPYLAHTSSLKARTTNLAARIFLTNGYSGFTTLSRAASRGLAKRGWARRRTVSRS